MSFKVGNLVFDRYDGGEIMMFYVITSTRIEGTTQLYRVNRLGRGDKVWDELAEFELGLAVASFVGPVKIVGPVAWDDGRSAQSGDLAERQAFLRRPGGVR